MGRTASWIDTPRGVAYVFRKMFGIGMPELAVILIVALVVLGPKRLPEVARQLGKAMAEFRRQTTGVVEEFQAQLTAEEEAERARAIDALRPKPTPQPSLVATPEPKPAGGAEPATPTTPTEGTS